MTELTDRHSDPPVIDLAAAPGIPHKRRPFTVLIPWELCRTYRALQLPQPSSILRRMVLVSLRYTLTLVRVSARTFEWKLLEAKGRKKHLDQRTRVDQHQGQDMTGHDVAIS